MAKSDVKRVLMDSSALLAWINGDLRAQRGHGRYVPRPLGGNYYEAVRKRGG